MTDPRTPRPRPGKSSVPPPRDSPEARPKAKAPVRGVVTANRGEPRSSGRDAVTPAAAPGPRIRVLIADDHQMFREALRRMLQMEPGIEVIGEASRGNEVAKLVSTAAPDVLLLDMQMPGATGLEVLKALTTAGASVRTILLTGTADGQQIVEAIRLGARGIVVKDAPIDLLFKSIRHVMDGNYWIGHDRIGELIASATRPERRPADTLTRRELQIVGEVAQGASNKAIGTRFGVSEQTVKNHLSAIFDKLGVSNRLELALYAVNHRLLDRVRPE